MRLHTSTGWHNGISSRSEHRGAAAAGSYERGFMMALGEERVEPGDELVWEEPVPLPAEPGAYRLAGWVASGDAPLAPPVPLVVRAR